MQGVECSNRSVSTNRINDLGQFGNDWPFFGFRGFCGTFHPAFLLSIFNASPLESVAYLVGLIDQFPQLRRRVVSGNAAVLVAQQGPPVLLGYRNLPIPSQLDHLLLAGMQLTL